MAANLGRVGAVGVVTVPEPAPVTMAVLPARETAMLGVRDQTSSSAGIPVGGTIVKLIPGHILWWFCGVGEAREFGTLGHSSKHADI